MVGIRAAMLGGRSRAEKSKRMEEGGEVGEGWGIGGGIGGEGLHPGEGGGVGGQVGEICFVELVEEGI